MWKVLIADDEPKIRQGLRRTLEQSGLPLQVVAEARNGLDALEKVKEAAPDILLVDICMPKLSGIEFLQEIYRQGRNCQAIVISGFDEFSYAQQAIELGVSSYLLKPIEEEVLRQALNRAMEKLHEREKSQKLQDLIRQQLLQHRVHLQNLFFNEWMEGQLQGENWQLQAELLNLNLSDKQVVAFVSVDLETIALPEGGRVQEHLYEYTIAQTIASCLPENEEKYLFVNRYQDVVVLLGAFEGDTKQLQKRLTEKIRELGAEKISIQFRGCSREELPVVHEELCGNARRVMECRPIVMEARKYIYANYGRRELDLPQTAEAIGCNPSYLSRIMKQELGMSFKDYLTTLRINQAILLMRKESLPLNVIAEMVGYSNQHYFSAAFKNCQGVSPSEYRRTMKSSSM